MLVVANEAAGLHDPREAALDDPAAADDDKALCAGRALHDFQDDVGLGLRPADEPAGVPAIGIDPFDEGEAWTGAAEHALGAVAVLNIGRVDLDRQQAPVGVGQDVPLAPVDLLAGVIAFGAPF